VEGVDFDEVSCDCGLTIQLPPIACNTVIIV
jgi:hypothetical protein